MYTNVPGTKLVEHPFLISKDASSPFRKHSDFFRVSAKIHFFICRLIKVSTLITWRLEGNNIRHISKPEISSERIFRIFRELKQRQRRRRRERHEFANLVGKNNCFARPARAFFTFVHFVAVVSKTTT